MEVKTGYGYFKDKEGNIIAKAELPVGEHPLKAGYTYVEVANRKALDAVKIYTPPESGDVKVARLISEKLRDLAIAELKKEGKLDAEGKIKGEG